MTNPTPSDIKRARAVVSAWRNRPKPTIAELEEILARPDEQVEILPEGEVTTASSKDELVDAIAAALAAARQEERDACADIAHQWQRPSAIKMAAGEMTAQELRTAQAVARGIESAIRARSGV